MHHPYDPGCDLYDVLRMGGVLSSLIPQTPALR